ncbi:alpha/beta fold hydrolase [Streptomyces sp. NPDC017966]|uniref:alpha/beta fold hydrolase n=1 Tax=Streptomyces sp. NPDC017966 TaxID=3365023 RepID=UPI0037AF0F86
MAGARSPCSSHALPLAGQTDLPGKGRADGPRRAAVRVGGTLPAYRDHGQGTPVILIHGTPSHAYERRDVVPHIEADGFRTVTYDLLGRGRSERPADRDTSVAARTDLLGRLLDALDIDQADVVAHDIGGAVGPRFAVDRPGRVRRPSTTDSVSHDSWPSPTWRQITDEPPDDLTNMSWHAFDRAKRLSTVTAPGSPGGRRPARRRGRRAPDRSRRRCVPQRSASPGRADPRS